MEQNQKEKENNLLMNKKPKLKDKIQYCFDNVIGKNPFFLILLGFIITMIIALIITIIISVFQYNVQESFLGTLWNVTGTTLNGWMPSLSDASINLTDSNQYKTIWQFLPLTAIAAIVGILFTSTLISILNTGMEEKLMKLRKGQSLVVEKDHIIIFGYVLGEYKLIKELILANSNKKQTIVIVTTVEKEEVEHDIQINVKVPQNIKIICRTNNSVEPNAISKLSIENAKAIIINHKDDDLNIKNLLAIKRVYEDIDKTNIKIVVNMQKEEHTINREYISNKNMIILPVQQIISQIVARACAFHGLANVLSEVLSFEGTEFYIGKFRNAIGHTFSKLSNSFENAIPIGIIRNDKTLLNPNGNEIIMEDDEIIYLSENAIEKDIVINDNTPTISIELDKGYLCKNNFLIIGCDDNINVVIKEISSRANKIDIIPLLNENEEEIKERISSEYYDIVNYKTVNHENIKELEEAVCGIDQIIILTDYNEENDKDSEIMFLLMKLNYIRKKKDVHFTVTAEMTKENNRNLISIKDPTDFIVSSNMVSLITAQLITQTKLVDTYTELFASIGNEFQVATLKALGLNTINISIRNLRQLCLNNHEIFVGYIKTENNKTKYVLNPPIDEEITLNTYDSLIGIGRNTQ